MATEVTKFENQQQMEVTVGGPAGANRLYVMTGMASLEGGGTGSVQVFRFLAGPIFEDKQFHRAVAMASPSRAGVATDLRIRSVDADRDEESGQVEVRVEVVFTGPGEEWISYHVTVLAERPE